MSQFQHHDDVVSHEEEDWETEDEDEDQEEYDEDEGDEEEQGEPEGVYDSPFFRLDQKGLMIHSLKRCAQCSRPSKNLCSTCKGVFYCGRDCQSKHWNQHKVLCKEMKQKLAKYAKEEEALKHCDDNFEGTPSNYFEGWFPGRFWGLHETRPFCRSIGDLVNTYAKYDTPQALREAILWSMKLLYFNRSDNMGFREQSAELLLRAGLDQEAYDFIRWYVKYPDDHYDWGNPSLPFLSYENSDRSEAIIRGNSYSYSMHHAYCMVLIKLRLYFVLEDVEAMYALVGAVKYEKGSVGSSSPLRILGGTADVLHYVKDNLLGKAERGYLKYVKNRNKDALLKQIHELMAMLEQSFSRIWKALANPRPLLAQPRPGSYSNNSAEETFLAVECCMKSWQQTPRAMQFVKKYVKEHGGEKYDAQYRRY